MILSKYTDSLLPFSASDLDTLQTEIKNKNIESWHTLMGNITQNTKDVAYRKAVKDTFKLMFRESREDEAMFVLDKEEYEIIFSKITAALTSFFEDDIEFRAIAAHFYRDARFGLSDFEKVINYATEAAEKGNDLGMSILAYQYYFGSQSKGVEQDKEKGFDYADKAILKNPINGAFTKAFLLFYDGNAEVAESIVNEIQDFENNYLASSIYTLKAELALQKNQTKEAIEFLEKAVQLNQSSHPYYLLGRFYLYGNEEIQPDFEKSISLLEKSFKKGASYAGLTLGTFLIYNDEFRDIDKGQAILEKTSSFNNFSASYELAKLYLFNEKFNTESNKEYKQKGISILENIKENHPPAYVELAYQLMIGENIAKDAQKSLNYLEQGAEKGYGYAAFYLGREYQNGIFSDDNSPNYQKALYWYERGAELDSVEAIEIAGKYYRLGVGVEPNPEKTLAYINKGIEIFNSDFSKIELALCYETGFGVERNYQKAFEAYQSVAENNNPYAHYRMGLYYRDGVLSENEEPDFEKAIHHFTVAANLDYPVAHYELSKATLYGNGIEIDTQKGLEMLHQDLENEIFDAAVDIALYYEANTDERNPEKAFEYMKKAVEDANAPYAMYKLGLYYYSGFGVEENNEEAKKYYQLAVNNNYQYANIPLGNMEFWQETEGSKEENGFEYYVKAAEFGYYNYGLGMCYKYGIGTERNLDKAYQALKQGHEQGDILAKYHLGMCYLEGDGTSKNETQSFELFESIAEYNNAAKYQLAKAYLDGKGTDKNVETGAKYLQEVAQEDYAPAQYDLGNLYLVGNGVEENTELAVEWFTKAAENGHKGAARIINPARNKRK
ncbi:hypothetical protein [Bernardetia sp. MNP-M8]|uniref:tetratricopeptide repeat protein n=1 Tax=Bernardetia sp. MNP-M8 TaxID=3127470 RepID=UPI0030CAEAAC